MVGSVEYIENIHRLALGLEVLDAYSQRSVVYPVRADVEYGLPHLPPKPKQQYGFAQQRGKLPVAMTRQNGTGRYSLVYQTGLDDSIDVRLYDYSRQYVPRRLRLPLLTLETVLNIEANEELEYVRGRIRQPVLFPGAAYDLMSKATGLRGRVLREGEPMPWAWIEAYSADDDLVGRARGDERGEFLLLLNPIVAGAGDLAASYDVTVRIYGPQVPDTPTPADLPDNDPLWNLPLEEVPVFGNPDGVSPGETLPDGYVVGANAVVPCQIGRVLTGVDTADFVFTVA